MRRPAGATGRRPRSRRPPRSRESGLASGAGTWTTASRLDGWHRSATYAAPCGQTAGTGRGCDPRHLSSRGSRGRIGALSPRPPAAPRSRHHPGDALPGCTAAASGTSTHGGDPIPPSPRRALPPWDPCLRRASAQVAGWLKRGAQTAVRVPAHRADPRERRSRQAEGHPGQRTRPVAPPATTGPTTKPRRRSPARHARRPTHPCPMTYADPPGLHCPRRVPAHDAQHHRGAGVPHHKTRRTPATVSGEAGPTGKEARHRARRRPLEPGTFAPLPITCEPQQGQSRRPRTKADPWCGDRRRCHRGALRRPVRLHAR